ncbi:MAG: ABC transporter permease [Planctomycetota bacterium]
MRKGSSMMAVLGIALVVVVFTVLLALSAGFERAVSASGSLDNLIVLRKGADAELQSQVTKDTGDVLRELPIVATGEGGKKLFLSETVIILVRKKADGGDTNVSVRGTTPNVLEVRREVKLKEGRWFTPGSDEAVIGLALSRRLEGLTLGQSMHAGRRDWKIVGVFDAGGSGLESEMWLDLNTMQGVFNRGTIYQSFLFQAAGRAKDAEASLKKSIEDDPRLQSIEVQVEKAYYEKQSKLMAGVINSLGGILTVIMAVGGVVGAMNTMYAAVSQRKREIGCMLAMGFSPESIWMAFILESLLLSLLGSILGCAASMLFDGMRTGTTNFMTFSETAFEFHVTPGILMGATFLALCMGFIGGLLPAIQAARLKVVEALRRS